MSEFTTDYVRKHHAQELEDFAEEFDLDYTVAAEKLGEFIGEFDVERGIEEAWEWAAEFGHEFALEDSEERRQRVMAEHGMVPGVAYQMGADGEWEGLY